jgi:hypothetical protein
VDLVTACRIRDKAVRAAVQAVPPADAIWVVPLGLATAEEPAPLN